MELKTSEEWQKLYPEPKVLDPDGWDRTNFQYSWYEELITLEQYISRVSISTVKGRMRELLDKEKPVGIKEKCEAMYAQIKSAHEELERLRKACPHTTTFEGDYSWRVGSILPATICSDCGELIKFNDPL